MVALLRKGLDIIIQWHGESRRVHLPLGASIVIGRDPQCDLHLDNPKWSRRHAAIHLDSEGLFLEDLGSRNGTLIITDGHQHTTQLESQIPAGVRHSISSDTLIQIGHALIHFDTVDARHDRPVVSDDVIVSEPSMLALYDLARRVEAWDRADKARLDLAGGRIVEFPTTLKVRVLGTSKMKIVRTIIDHLGLLVRLTALRLTGGQPSIPRRTSGPVRQPRISGSNSHV